MFANAFSFRVVERQDGVEKVKLVFINPIEDDSMFL